MHAGKIVELAATDELFADPKLVPVTGVEKFSTMRRRLEAPVHPA